MNDDRKIFTEKLYFREKAQSKIRSLENADYQPKLSDKEIFNDHLPWLRFNKPNLTPELKEKINKKNYSLNSKQFSDGEILPDKYMKKHWHKNNVTLGKEGIQSKISIAFNSSEPIKDNHQGKTLSIKSFESSSGLQNNRKNKTTENCIVKFGESHTNKITSVKKVENGNEIETKKGYSVKNVSNIMANEEVEFESSYFKNNATKKKLEDGIETGSRMHNKIVPNKKIKGDNGTDIENCNNRKFAQRKKLDDVSERGPGMTNERKNAPLKGAQNQNEAKTTLLFDKNITSIKKVDAGTETVKCSMISTHVQTDFIEKQQRTIKKSLLDSATVPGNISKSGENLYSDMFSSSNHLKKPLVSNFSKEGQQIDNDTLEQVLSSSFDNPANDKQKVYSIYTFQKPHTYSKMVNSVEPSLPDLPHVTHVGIDFLDNYWANQRKMLLNNSGNKFGYNKVQFSPDLSTIDSDALLYTEGFNEKSDYTTIYHNRNSKKSNAVKTDRLIPGSIRDVSRITANDLIRMNI